MIKKGVYYKLREQSIDKIKTLAEEKNINYTDALELMIDSYFVDRTEEFHLLTESWDGLMNEKIAQIDAKLEKIRITSNVIDRHTQMGLEFWNHYFAANQFKQLGSTELYRTEELKEAELIVRNRIAHNRQKKLDWEQAKQKKETKD